MSRAFVNEDADQPSPLRFALPPPEDDGYPAAAAFALIEAARHGLTSEAEQATGYRFGEPYLRDHVAALLEREQQRPQDERDRRLIQVAKRFLRAAG